jgi:hypothetical protein
MQWVKGKRKKRKGKVGRGRDRDLRERERERISSYIPSTDICKPPVMHGTRKISMANSCLTLKKVQLLFNFFPKQVSLSTTIHGLR